MRFISFEAYRALILAECKAQVKDRRELGICKHGHSLMGMGMDHPCPYCEDGR